MSIANRIIQDNPDKYETLLKSRILGKTLQLKLNQYNALQSQYDTLLQYENNNRKPPSVEVKEPCIDKYASCPQWKSYCGPNSWMKENCQQTCDTCEKEDNPIQPSGYWTDIQNQNYQFNMVSNPTGSTDDWKFLGKTDSLDDCKLKAVENDQYAFSSVVYYPSDFDTDWKKSCFGGVKGKNINPQTQSNTITSLAPNGTSQLGGEEGANLLKQMKSVQNEIHTLTTQIKRSGDGLDKTKSLFDSENIAKNNELDQLLAKLEKDRIEINKTLNEPDETAKEDDSHVRQVQNYTTYGLWLLLVIISLSVVFYLYMRNDSDIPVYIYLFIAVWILVFIKYYYNTFLWYGDKTWKLIMSIPIPIP